MKGISHATDKFTVYGTSDCDGTLNFGSDGFYGNEITHLYSKYGLDFDILGSSNDCIFYNIYEI